jgi:peptidoglycan DL-endopeptidase LytE
MLNRFWDFRGASACGILFFLFIAIPSPAAAGGVYFVKEGDTLSKISLIFGVDAEALRETNHLQSSAVKPGDRIRIPDISIEPKVLSEGARHQDFDPDRVLQTICRDETVYHTVAKGDTLSSIARRYEVEIEALLRLNEMNKRAKLSIGQRILVRRSGPRSHTVARGETLFRIASRYRIGVDDLARLNQLDGERITPGQRLVLEPCDPYAAAGSAPPPLGGPDADVSPNGDLPAPPAADLSQRVTDLARSMLDIPYRFGGSTLRGIDCSAYVQRVFGLMDIKIPRTAREQFAIGAGIVRDELAVGDLVFFRTYASYPSHVGIYLGDDQFIHASSMVRKVTIDRLDLPYYRQRFLGGRRLGFDDAPALAAAP